MPTEHFSFFGSAKEATVTANQGEEKGKAFNIDALFISHQQEPSMEEAQIQPTHDPEDLDHQVLGLQT